ncbi:MAG: hypothetical protein WC455_21060 [Dehalococcoidia bacterium]|jgi:hypothetical protein
MKFVFAPSTKGDVSHHINLDLVTAIRETKTKPDIKTIDFTDGESLDISTDTFNAYVRPAIYPKKEE